MMLNSGAVERTYSNGPSTELCGTQNSTADVTNHSPPYMTCCRTRLVNDGAGSGGRHSQMPPTSLVDQVASPFGCLLLSARPTKPTANRSRSNGSSCMLTGSVVTNCWQTNTHSVDWPRLFINFGTKDRFVTGR
jgi:hypothetical protein